MNNIKSNHVVFWFAGCAFVLIMMQIVMSQHFEIQSLRQEQRLSDEAKKLADDQINELNYTVYRLTTEREGEATRQFVLGVVQALKNKDHYNAIWHEGYNAGEAVAEYATQHDPKIEKDQSGGLLP